MENQIVLAMDDEQHNKFIEPELEAINGEEEEEEEPEELDDEDEYDQRQYSSHLEKGVQLLDKVDNASGYNNLEQSGRDSSEGKLFVGGISWETSEVTFSNYFRKYGEIADSVIMMDKITGRPRGFGFVTFADPADADKVLEKEHIIDGRTVEVKRTVPRGDMQQQQQVTKGVTKTKKIFVGGIPPSFTEDEMKEYFSSYGSVVEHQIMLDHSTGRSRGFGFVTFETEDAVDRVFADGQRHELGGKQVEIKRAEPKRSEGGTSSGAQRSSYGSGGGFRSSGAAYGGRNASRGGYGGAKGRGYGGSGGADGGYDNYDSYSGNYGGGTAGSYGGYGAGGYGYGFGGSMYGAPGGYPGYGIIPGYGAGRGYGAGGGMGGYGAGRGYGGSDGGYAGRGYNGGMEGGYGAGRGYGGGFEGGYGTGGGYGSGEGEYGNSRGYDRSSAASGGSRGRGSSGYGGDGDSRGYGNTGSGGIASARYHPYQR